MATSVPQISHCARLMFPSKEEKSFTTWSKPPLFLQNRQQVGAMKGKSSCVKEGVVKYKRKYNNAVVKYKRKYNYNSGYKGVEYKQNEPISTRPCMKKL